MIPRGNLLADTQVASIELVPGRFRAHIPQAWQALSAYGGVVVAVAHRAAQCAVDRPSLDPLFVGAIFSAPVPCGDVEIETSVLPGSPTVAYATAMLYAKGDDRPRTQVQAVFGQRVERPQRIMEARFPEGILMPADAISAQYSLGAMPVLQQWEVRWAHEFGTRPGRHGPEETEPVPREPAVTSSWMRLHEVPRRADGTLDPLSFAVPADALASAIFRGLGVTVPPFAPVTLAMDLHIYRTTRREWILQHVRLSQLADGYASGIVELWDEDRQLLAAGTQLRVCKPFKRS